MRPENRKLGLDSVLNKNMAIANRSRIGCTHDTSTASIITLWPWNLG